MVKKENPSSLQQNAFLVLAVCAFSYIAIRSYTLPLVNDESETFLSFVQNGRFLPWTSSHISANNHILNSFLTWISYHLFGMQEWALRLPNVLSFAIFLFYTFKLGKKIHNTWLRWFLWISVLFSHYLIEFFGYSRGYGLSLAFLTAGIYHLMESRSSPEKNSRKSFLFMTLGLFANLNFLFIYLLWLFFDFLLYNKSKPGSFPLWRTAIRFLPFVLCVMLALKLKESGQLYYGTGAGIRAGLHSLMMPMFPGWDEVATNFLIIVMAFITIAFPIITFVKKESLFSPFSLFFSFLVVNIIFAAFAFYVLQVKFPVERTLLHWYLLFLFSTFFGLDRLIAKFRLRWLTIAGIPFLLTLFFFFKVAGFHSSTGLSWYLEQIPETFTKYLEKENKSRAFPHTIAGMHGVSVSNWAYENLKSTSPLNIMHSYKQDHMTADYQIVNTDRFPHFKEYYKEVLYDPYSRNSLMKRKRILERNIKYQQKALPVSTTEEEFYGLFAIKSDSLQDVNVQLDYEIAIECKDDFFEGLLVVNIIDSSGASLKYRQVSLDHYCSTWENTEPLKLSLYFAPLPEGAVEMKSFIWNFYREEFSLISANCSISELK